MERGRKGQSAEDVMKQFKQLSAAKQARSVGLLKGVSSKYLNNYLTWNNAVEHGGGTLREKAARILASVTSTPFEETCLNVTFRPVLPLLVKNQS